MVTPWAGVSWHTMPLRTLGGIWTSQTLLTEQSTTKTHQLSAQPHESPTHMTNTMRMMVDGQLDLMEVLK